MNEDAQKIKDILDQFQGLAEGVNKSSPFGEEVKKPKKFEVEYVWPQGSTDKQYMTELLNTGWRIAVAAGDCVVFVREVEAS